MIGYGGAHTDFAANCRVKTRATLVHVHPLRLHGALPLAADPFARTFVCVGQLKMLLLIHSKFESVRLGIMTLN
jgi:hypothetical protein